MGQSFSDSSKKIAMTGKECLHDQIKLGAKYGKINHGLNRRELIREALIKQSHAPNTGQGGHVGVT